MRFGFFAALAVGALAGLDTAPAQARDYPYCMRTMYDSDDCSYASYAQCQVTSSGLGTWCFQNPALAYGQPRYEEPQPRRRSRQRHND